MRSLSVADALTVYEDALRQGPTGLERLHAVGEDGSRRQLPIRRWLGTPDATEEAVLARARGPVLDVGCGAGRHVVALGQRGIEAMGVEVSSAVAAIARSRGAIVVEGSIFATPLLGNWATALLLDGNVGIGGDAAVLLRRVGELLQPGGQVLVELEPPASGPHTGRVRLESASAVSRWVPWHFVAADEIEGPAASAGLAVAERWTEGARWFAALRKERRR
ncbi:MAG TPA: class I SAM-dependent methyltransferase [Solirubrobacterales bacterium]